MARILFLLSATLFLSVSSYRVFDYKDLNNIKGTLKIRHDGVIRNYSDKDLFIILEAFEQYSKYELTVNATLKHANETLFTDLHIFEVARIADRIKSKSAECQQLSQNYTEIKKTDFSKYSTCLKKINATVLKEVENIQNEFDIYQAKWLAIDAENSCPISNATVTTLQINEARACLTKLERQIIECEEDFRKMDEKLEPFFKFLLSLFNEKLLECNQNNTENKLKFMAQISKCW